MTGDGGVLDRLKDGARIGVWGYGLEGRSVERFLRTHYPGAPLSLYDGAAKSAEVFDQDRLIADIEARRLDVLFKSPGIPLSSPVAVLARKSGALLTSATNLWFALHPTSRSLAITGTKGKSTTSKLLHWLLRREGIDAALGGNYGLSLLDLPSGADVYVIELSSYQLADLAYAPSFGAITSLYPDHVDWHGGVGQYYADKTRALSALPADRLFVSGGATATLEEIHAGVEYTSVTSAAGKDGCFTVNGRSFTVRNNPLLGAHNLDNLALALRLMQEFTAVTEIDLAGFEPLKHRLEPLGSVGGVSYICDTISTTAESTLAALASVEAPAIAMVLGGQDRDQNYPLLAKSVEARAAAGVRLSVYPTSDNRALLEQAFAEYAPSVHCEGAANYTACFAAADARLRAEGGGVLLFSPAAARDKGFPDIRERGWLLEAYVKERRATET